MWEGQASETMNISSPLHLKWQILRALQLQNLLISGIHSEFTLDLVGKLRLPSCTWTRAAEGKHTTRCFELRP